MEPQYLSALRARVSVARQLHKLSTQRERKRKTSNWFQQKAKALDMILDEDMYPLKISRFRMVQLEADSLAPQYKQLLYTVNSL